MGLFVGAGISAGQANVARSRAVASRWRTHSRRSAQRCSTPGSLVRAGKDTAAGQQPRGEGRTGPATAGRRTARQAAQVQLERLNDERLRSGAQLGPQIKTLAEAQERLRTETGALVTRCAGRTPRAVGPDAAAQGRGARRHGRIATSPSRPRLPASDRTLRPDMVVNLPGGKHIASTPRRRCGRRLLDAAPDEETRARHLRRSRPLLRGTSSSSPTRRIGAVWIDPGLRRPVPAGEHLYGAGSRPTPS